MKTSSFKASDGSLINFIHNDLDHSKTSILFVHGLGDSSLAWKPFVEDSRFSDYNLLAPDLVGYGDSKYLESCDFGYLTHAKHIFELIAHLGIKDLIIVGHSMGGVIASYMVSCYENMKSIKNGSESEKFKLNDYTGVDPANTISEDQSKNHQIFGLINVEGNLTSSDAFISGRAVKAFEKGSYVRWFNAFLEATSGSWITENPKAAHYSLALSKCNPKAFLQGSKDLNFWKENYEDTGVASAGELYRSINLPKIFAYGTKSMSKESLDYLTETDIDSVVFEGAEHWVMNDEEELFAKLLAKMIKAWS